MDTLFVSTIFLFPCLFLIFFVSLDGSLSDQKMVYEDGLKNFFQLDLPGVVGPESIAFDCNGKGPYVSVSDGRILKWQGAKLGWTEFAVSSSQRDRQTCDGSTDIRLEPICGRPLGIKFNPTTCDLYIADAYNGLLVVGPKGGVATQLAASAGGLPFRFLNALDVDAETGTVYFTDSSIYFQRREYLLSIITADKTGRLLKYDPNGKNLTELARGLAFPNGVALSKDRSFILVAESAPLRILKFPLLGSETNGQGEVFAQFGRFPDNIKRTDNGEFWVGLNSGRGRIRRVELDSNSKRLQQETEIQWLMNDPVAVKLSSGGKVINFLDGNGGTVLNSVSEVVEERSGRLWIGSSSKPYLGYIKKTDQN